VHERTRFDSRIARWAVSYYGLVPLVVPSVLLVGLVAAATLSIPFHLGITASSIVSAGLLADAMFN
jgi:hypothetical protein